MIKAKFTKGQTINYKSGQFVASGEVVNIEEKMHFGTKQVIYSFQHMFTRDGDYPLAHYKFFVDSDEATRYRTTLYGAYTIMLQELRFIISIT